MSYIKLNGREFDADVAISAYSRNFNVLDGDNAGRVMTGRMIRDIIGYKQKLRRLRQTPCRSV